MDSLYHRYLPSIFRVGIEAIANLVINLGKAPLTICKVGEKSNVFLTVIVMRIVKK